MANEEVGASAPQEVVAKPVSYFGTSETFTCMLPDGVQYVEHKRLNEGERKKYQNASTYEQTTRRDTNEIKMKMRLGDERHMLLEVAITNVHMFGPDGNPVPWGRQTLRQLLENGDTDIIDIIEEDIRKHNKWLLQMATLESVEEEITRLEEHRDYLKGQEAKNAR